MSKNPPTGLRARLVTAFNAIPKGESTLAKRQAITAAEIDKEGTVQLRLRLVAAEERGARKVLIGKELDPDAEGLSDELPFGDQVYAKNHWLQLRHAVLVRLSEATWQHLREHDAIQKENIDNIMRRYDFDHQRMELVKTYLSVDPVRTVADAMIHLGLWTKQSSSDDEHIAATADD